MRIRPGGKKEVDTKILFFSIFFLFSTWAFAQGNQNADDFNLKERCSKYLNQAEVNAQKLKGLSGTASLQGVFYSRKLNTCVSITQVNENFTNPVFMVYQNALTGIYLKTIFNVPKDQGGLGLPGFNRQDKEYRKSLDLLE